MRERLDDIQKKLRGLDALEKRVAKLEKQRGGPVEAEALDVFAEPHLGDDPPRDAAEEAARSS